MSTEDDQSIMFNIAHNRQKYRLLELPPDLLELVSSTAPSQYVEACHKALQKANR